MAIVQSDVLNFAEEVNFEKNIKEKITYITKLYNEEVHIIAKKEIRSIKSIIGKTVSIGGKGSGTAMTAKTIFNALDIPITPVYYSNQEALSKLKLGEIDAAVFVAGKPTPLIGSITEEDGLHLLKIGLDKRVLMQKGYLSSSFGHNDYPNLVGENTIVNTLAVGAVLAVYNFPNTTDRYQRLEWFTQKLYESLPDLKKDAGKGKTYHEKWLDLDFNNELPGWRRFFPANKLIN